MISIRDGQRNSVYWCLCVSISQHSATTGYTISESSHLGDFHTYFLSGRAIVGILGPQRGRHEWYHVNASGYVGQCTGLSILSLWFWTHSGASVKTVKVELIGAQNQAVRRSWQCRWLRVSSVSIGMCWEPRGDQIHDAGSVAWIGVQ